MTLPSSAADSKPEVPKDEDVMIIVQGNRFMMSLVDAISLAGTINAVVAGKLSNGRD